MLPALRRAERFWLWPESLVRALPPRQRETLVLRYYLELSEEETARSMGVRRGTVKSATSRALAALGQRMQEYA